MRVAFAIVVLAALGAASSAAAERQAASRFRVGSYCSPSGDLCYGVFRRQREIIFSIDTFARYFARYALCVRAPDGSSRCGRFPIFRRAMLYGSDVPWSRNFPDRGAGVYRVSWKHGSTPLGPTLRFRRGS